MFAALAVMLLVNVIPEGTTSRRAHAQSADSSIEFAENRTAAVAVFIAYDQDGDAISWSLSGPDALRFTIDGGVLAFRESPDYEDPRSAARTNVYRVTVEASGGTHDVAVTVLDVDEAGTVEIDRPQPQASRPLGASLSDEDEGVSAQTWQWARSADGVIWVDIVGATSPRRIPVPDDVGMYLRATVTYSDKFGSDKTASAISFYRVEAKTLSNAAPSFAEQDEDEATSYIDIDRSVAENTTVGKPVGRPVSALDSDEDILLYELLDTPDLEDNNGNPRFTIDSLSGQIRVGKELGADAGETEDEDSTNLVGAPELPEGDDAEEPGNSEYVLRVRVSDPSTASATVNVIVTVSDMNEPPLFDEDVPTVLRVTENQEPPVITFGDGDTPVAASTYAVTDRDINVSGPHPYDDTSYSYSVSGADHSVLALTGDGILSFREGHEVDYEERSSYSITIVARSGEGPRRLTATLDVTIEVADAEDPGQVSLSQRQPQIGKSVHATVSDPDGGVRVTRWVWERSAEVTVDGGGTPSAECRDDLGTPGIGVVGGWTPIGEASSSVYTVQEADVNRCLRATATYTDDVEIPADVPHQVEGVTEAPVQRSNPANTAPHFVVQTGRTSRRVVENTEAGHDIGRPVSAHDDDGDLLIYTLGGADAAAFDISRNNGQLKALAPLDYEARRTYTLEVTVTDPSGADDTIQVSIRLTNRDEPAEITGTSTATFAEDSTSPVASFSANDPEGRSIRWSLSGRDADRFTISRGTMRFKRFPDYEDPHSALEGASLEERNVYRVTVEASGGTHEVAVMVTDVDETGTASLDRPQPQAERPLSAILLDEDEGVTGERWQWARSEDGTVWTDIEGATLPRRSPVSADVGMYLRAAVTYSDKFGSGKSAAAVSANRVEAKTLSNAAPSFEEQDEDEATPYIEIVRAVAENAAAGTAIGEPVSALDEDEDVLFYELVHTPDLEDDDGHVRFTIDSATGQIRVGEELGGADDGERTDEDSTSLAGSPDLPEGEDADDADNSEYVLRVRAIDPSTASATVNVIVKVTEVNEAPTFDEDAPVLLRVKENVETPVLTFGGDDTPVDVSTYAVTDQDGSVTGPDGYDDTNYTYSVSGTDSRYFAFNSTGVLGFRANREPDFEDKSSYSITILARSGVGSRRLTARLDVAIDVVNTHDAGEVRMSQRQPQVGIEVLATLSDPDGGVAIIRWAWERTVDDDLAPSARCEDIDTDEDWTAIAEASSAVYLPTSDDVGRCLRATAVYTDNLDDTELEATGVLEVPVRGIRTAGPVPLPPTVNAAPVFPDQDFLTEGDQSDRTSREVAEDIGDDPEAGRYIGAPVFANDADGDLLIYTLGGTDARHFRIIRNSGQLRTRAPLNYEARDTYTVVVTATDPIGASDSIVVTINVIDEDDPAEITVNTAETVGGF